jgi:deoxyribose-phosphate aldolase
VEVQAYIEHTNLSPTVTGDAIENLVSEALKHNFLGICIPPFWVKKARRDLGKSSCKVVTVAGFPLGYQMTESKLKEIEVAIDDGVDEVDIVWHISAFKSGMTWPKIEIAKAAGMVHASGKILKVIIETAYLSKSEIQTACGICVDAGADFIKTSTGHAPSGAKIEEVRYIREIIPDIVGIKASGGIKNYDQARQFIEAGADRLGTSSGIEIMRQQYETHRD